MGRLVGAGIAVVSGVFAACFSTPRFLDGDARTDDDANDAPKDSPFETSDVLPANCVSDNFSGSGSGSGCGSSGWAARAGSGAAFYGGGHLQLQYSSSAGSYIHCVSPALTHTRFIVDVLSAGQDATGSTTFVGLTNGFDYFGTLFTWDGMASAPGFQVLCGQNPVVPPSAVPIDARFIRILMLDADTVSIGVSSDGSTYRALDQCGGGSGGLASTNARVTLARNAGTNLAVTSLFGYVEVCHE